MLEITNLKAAIHKKTILNQFNLNVKQGEIHAIMGPNGSGKSTLAKAITGAPEVEIKDGSIILDNKDLKLLPAEERALSGVFLGFQYPTEIPGVNNNDFLRLIYNAKQKYLGLEELDPFDFAEILTEKLQIINLNPSFLDRSINEGFSGGEKKRNELLQMAILEPRIAILDEIDSGLDIDSLKEVSAGINKLRSKERSIILITHYQRLLDFVEPDIIHVMNNGKIIESGDKSLAHELEKKGYDFFKLQA
ncbi:MAG: Fe-S cluster assembly ATPase SufC [Candidatus Margulisiibacteriota bacterium]|jgi:Fe-S cluster assembly ATP-binding protein